MASMVDVKAPAGTGAQANGISSSTLILPDFSVFGDEIANAADKYCRLFGINADFLFSSMLAVASGIVGAKRQLKIHQSWRVIPALWCANVGAPSTGKTPAALAALDPVFEEQRRRRDKFEMESVTYEDLLAQYQRDVKAKRPDAEKPDPPILNHAYATSLTLEGLSRELSHNPSIITFADELAGWWRSFDKYRAGDDRQQWLSIWSGTPSNNLRADPTKATSFMKPNVAILGGLQPSVLPQLTGGVEDGLAARFLFVAPEIEPMVDSLELLDDPLHDVWTRKCENLFDLRETELTPSRSTKEAYQNWQREWRKLFDAKEETPLNYAMLKMEQHVWRFSIITQTLYDPESPYVDFRAIQQATRIADYYHRHLLKVYDHSAADELDALAQRVVKWAMGKDKATFSPRDIVQGSVLPRGKRKTSTAIEVIREIADREYMTVEMDKEGRPFLVK